jgi:hypothetical protein
MRKYLENALSQAEQQEVELHLKHCSHCSGIIVEYVENEEPEYYKAHMNKLKGKLNNDVKPRKRGFTYGRIKLIRAAAAVAALFVFSFFALNTMVEKDFNLISKADKAETELPKLGANPKKTQKPKASTPILKEKKTDVIQDEVEMQEEEEIPEVLPKKKVSKPAPAQPKPVAAKPQEEAKETTTKKAEEKIATPENTLAEVTEIAKKEDTSKGEEKPAESPAVDKEEEEKEQAEVIESIQPLQKIEKLDTETEKKVSPEAKNIQNIPSNSVGQLRQE